MTTAFKKPLKIRYICCPECKFHEGVNDKNWIQKKDNETGKIYMECPTCNTKILDHYDFFPIIETYS